MCEEGEEVAGGGGGAGIRQMMALFDRGCFQLALSRCERVVRAGDVVGPPPTTKTKIIVEIREKRTNANKELQIKILNGFRGE